MTSFAFLLIQLIDILYYQLATSMILLAGSGHSARYEGLTVPWLEPIERVVGVDENLLTVCLITTC